MKKGAKSPGHAGKKKPKKPAKAKDTASLTAMQAAFVQHYVIEKNATEAAKKAGYSEKAAAEQGYENLRKPQIRSAIDEKFRQQNERLDIRADRVLLEIYRLATVDISRAYDESGNLLPIHEIPEEVRRCIESIETEQELVPGTGDEDTPPEMVTIKKVKFASKKPVLELLAKHFKMLTDTLEVKGKITLEDLVARSNDPSSAKD